MHRSIPSLDGRDRLAGLRAPVTVKFDRFAVPHVFARDDVDAWRAVGYLQARDRLWQMELYRRAAAGRLSELLGEATLPVDRRFRVLDLRGAAELEWEATSGETRRAFEAFAAGVNAAMAVPFGRLPLELQLLRTRPEPWTPLDSLAISKLFAWRLGENHRAELLRYDLMAAVGEAALELLPGPPEWAPAVLGSRKSRVESRESKGRVVSRSLSLSRSPSRSHDDPQAGAVSGGRPATRDPRRATPALRLAANLVNGTALSNAWVVSGARTTTGRPLLANDPHLNVEMPAVWWEAHVATDGFNVRGVMIPGIPFVIIGHNERLAWGLTNVGADVQDFFVEQLDASGTKYRVGDGWEPLTEKTHEIRIAGRESPVSFTVKTTRHGPILDSRDWRDVEPGTDAGSAPLGRTALALKWTVVREPGSASAFDALARTANWGEFVAAVRRFNAPAQNFVYADADGNIGYAMSGLVPIRHEGDGRVPAPGWPAGADWRGYLSVALLPAMLNPPEGHIVTANNEVGGGLPYHITSDWVSPFRAQRIAELLGSRRSLDASAMRDIQADVTSLAAKWVLDAIEIPPALDELRGWDARMDDRPAALLYQSFEAALWRRTFADELPHDLYDRFYRYAANERFAGLPAIVADPDSPWFDDARTPGRETRADIVRAAADEALAHLYARYGPRSSWNWTGAHAVTFEHPLAGGGRLLDWFFSRGPVPLAGDGTTINKAMPDLRRPYATSEAASYRQILEAGAWDSSSAVIPTGQSGHPQSPHYFDQNALWRDVVQRPSPFSREAVDRATVSQLELVP